MGQLRPLFVYCRSFQTSNTYFTTNQCEKCPSSIRCRDSNPQPFEHESSPITTRPGHVMFLLHNFLILFFKWAYPGHILFIFILFQHKFYRKNRRLQGDSNSDRQIRRQAPPRPKFVKIIFNNF